MRGLQHPAVSLRAPGGARIRVLVLVLVLVLVRVLVRVSSTRRIGRNLFPVASRPSP
ncbi:protein of unknown function [Thauera humireducens]|nr:protein of unknown function [Thauera humireducens]